MRYLRNIIALSSLCLSLITALAAAESKKPNIVYILVDDAGYGDFGCYGQKTLLTPNVDQLASEGMRFTRHYAGAAVCAPARCVLMTGLHTGHSRVRANGPASIPDTDLTVARLLKDAGYLTACIGKYGLGMPLPPDDPQRKGFDYFFGYVDTAHAHNGYPTYLFRNGVKVPLSNQIIPGSENKPGTGVATPDGRKQWAPQLLADDVQRYLDDRGKDKNRPFFLYYTLNLPHANNEAGANSPLGHGMETPSYGEFASRDWPDVEKGFASAMKFVDREVGAVMVKLKALGLEDDTIVMFSSDNGPHQEGGHKVAFFQSNDGLTGMKRDLTEGGVREPFIVRWPNKVKPGTISEHVSGFQDFLPTTADLAGAKVTAECDGISFLPTLLGQKDQQKQHPYLFWYASEKGGKRSVLKWPWKLLHLNTGSADSSDESESTAAKKRPASVKALVVELFNLETDPTESKNVAAENPQLLGELEAIMQQAWRDPK
ncbi:MAG: N-acetylgalactosamine-6-sulfatase [Opitutaceae bacterium]|nr:N-acetylgalactosamine-6-sulfatase [Opitutaceae bacterium]